MKKFIAFTLAMSMTLSMLTGCGKSEPPAAENPSATDTSTVESKAPAVTGDGKYSIGVILYGKEDTLGGRIYSLLNDAAEALDCDITFSLGDFDTTAQITAAENLIAAGADGIICLPLAETTSQKLSQLCKENEIYFGLLLRSMYDPAINEEVRANPYFVGNILGDDVGNAKELTRILIEEYDCANLCTYFAPEGTSMALRNEGIKEAIAEYGGRQLAEATTPSDSNMAPVAGVMQNFINTNADIQGIVSASGSSGIGETIGSTMQTMNVEGAKYACFDTYDGMVGSFESGYLAVVCGGQAPACLYLFSMLYNAIDGVKLTESGEELLMTYMFIRSSEEAQNFLDYIDNPEVPLYTEDEIKAMTVRYNPEFSWDALNQIMAEYTYENIMAKLGR